MNSIRQPFIALVATFLAALSAAGQVPDQLKFTIPNPAPGDGFGGRVAISGTLVVVGATFDMGAKASSVYVYDLSSAAPTVPLATLNNPSPATDDFFGFSVAISGNRVVVGDTRGDTGATNAGSAYVYDLSGATPTAPVATLNNPSPSAYDDFGWSVGISGTRVVVGAPGDDTRGTQTGAAYVYDLSSAIPSTPVVTLNYPGFNVDDFGTYFGWAVGIDGLRVVVGESIVNAWGARSYVYDLGSATPAAPVARLRDPDISDIRVSGSVAISGTTVVARAWTRNAGNSFYSVYVFEMSSATPTVPVARLLDPSPSPTPDYRFDQFGSSVAISGTWVVVGDFGDDTGATNSGIAYVYDLSSATPTTPVATLDNPTPAADASFGYSVAIEGTTVAIAASGEVATYIFGPASPPVDGDNDGLLDSWELTYWPTTAGHGPLDDFDHDGNPELLELAFGLNPTVSDPAGLPTPIVEGDYLTMTIAKRSGVTYEVQSAGTVLAGSPDSFSPATTTVLLENNTTLKVRDNILIGSQPARFLRVQVTAAP